jgi:hypothetical protein
MCNYKNSGYGMYFCFLCKKEKSCNKWSKTPCKPQWKGETTCIDCITECPDRVEGLIINDV